MLLIIRDSFLIPFWTRECAIAFNIVLMVQFVTERTCRLSPLGWWKFCICCLCLWLVMFTCVLSLGPLFSLLSSSGATSTSTSSDRVESTVSGLGHRVSFVSALRNLLIFSQRHCFGFAKVRQVPVYSRSGIIGKKTGLCYQNSFWWYFRMLLNLHWPKIFCIKFEIMVVLDVVNALVLYLFH